jgi:SNF2 family DNA or RNA helicase
VRPTVTVSATLRGGVVLVPRTRDDRFVVASAVRSLGLEPRLESGRVHVDSTGAACLLAGVEGIDLRWDDDAREHVEGRLRATDGRVVVAEAVRALDEGGVAAASAMLAGVEVVAGLDYHQVVNVAAMTVPGGHGLCLFDEQGAGKTVSVVAAFDVLAQRDEVDFMLVLAPKSMLAEWKRDIDRFTAVYRVAVYAGSAAERRSAIASRPDVLVANYEAAVNDAGSLGAVVARHGRRGVLVVDESFHVKNLATSRSQATLALRRRMGRTFVLCGTPAPNRADDVVAQVSLIDFGLTFDGVALPDDRDEAVPVVRAALDASPLHRRNLKANVLPDLPGRTFTRIPVALAPRQRALYDAAEHDLIDELRHVGDREFARSLTTWAARRSALLRLCSNPAGVVDGYDEEPAKLLALDGIVDRFVRDRGEKLVVWSFFTASLTAIAARYEELGAVRYDGTVTSVENRARSVRAFQEDPSTKLFVANPAAAGAGLTLHAARLAVYESLSNQAAHYLQSLDRVHRRGQMREVEYFFLVADDTLESAEYERLSRKHAAARDLLGDDDPLPVTRHRLLAELAR